MGQIYRVVQLAKEYAHDQAFAHEIVRAVNVYSESFSMRFFVHDALFRNVINMLGTKEQAKMWNDDIANFRVYGCFAMVYIYHTYKSICSERSYKSNFLLPRQSSATVPHYGTLRRRQPMIRRQTSSWSIRPILPLQSGGSADLARRQRMPSWFARPSFMANGKATTGSWCHCGTRWRASWHLASWLVISARRSAMMA